MTKWFCIFIVICTLFISTAVRAQAPVTIDSLEIDIWPEYDQPGILVIYRIQLPSGTLPNTQLSLQVPKQVSNITIARLGSDGVLYEIKDFTRAEKGDWSTVSFVAPVSQVQFEYYIPNISREGKQRSFTFNWPGDYAVNTMSVQLQQPLGATAMQITPSLGSGIKGTDNLTYYNAMIGSVSEGSFVAINVQYQKETDDLTNPKSQLRSSEPITTATPGRAPQLKQVLSYTLGGVGILVILISLVYYWRTTRKSRAPLYKRHAPAASRIDEPTEMDDAGYCQECGKRALVGDRFCRACGTPLRREA